MGEISLPTFVQRRPFLTSLPLPGYTPVAPRGPSQVPSLPQGQMDSPTAYPMPNPDKVQLSSHLLWGLLRGRQRLPGDTRPSPNKPNQTISNPEASPVGLCLMVKSSRTAAGMSPSFHPTPSHPHSKVG